MRLVNSNDVSKGPVDVEGAESATIQWLIGKDDGAPTFAMRLFELQPGGHTPLHRHAHEHEVFVVEGHGVVVCEGESFPIGSEDAILMPGGKEHCFENTSDVPLRFLCLIPISAA
ncbi:MAG: cupin domain-containing protein [Sedimentisphaerales bacterium]|nr:cupin domain-containing protein [Sedimentisphaerales bacterium]